MAERPHTLNFARFIEQYQASVESIHQPCDIDRVVNFARIAWFQRRAGHDPLLVYIPYGLSVPSDLEVGIKSRDVRPETLAGAVWNVGLSRFHGSISDLTGNVNDIGIPELALTEGSYDSTKPLSFTVSADLSEDHGKNRFRYQVDYMLALHSLIQPAIKKSVRQIAEWLYSREEIQSRKILYMHSRRLDPDGYRAFLGGGYEQNREIMEARARSIRRARQIEGYRVTHPLDGGLPELGNDR